MPAEGSLKGNEEGALMMEQMNQLKTKSKGNLRKICLNFLIKLLESH